MKQRLGKVALLSVTAAGLLAASFSANARSIRIDDDGGDGIWTEPVASSTVSNIGFTFNFFGTTTTSLTINSNGSVSFGGAAVIAPFLDDTATNPFSYSTTNVGEEPTPGIPNAIRIQWGSVDSEGIADSDNLFQLAIFNLTNDVFAMEFNYGQITAGSDATSSIGFDNGAGTSTDLLADLGGVLGLGGPLLFADYNGIGNYGFDPDNQSCPNPGNILACNNYNAETGDFGSLANLLPSDFGGYFQSEASTGVDAQGRYFFLIDNNDVDPDPNPVPAPGTLWLLGAGMAGLGLSRRRRKAGSQTP